MKYFSLIGRSGSGKTTLVTKLIPIFVEKGLKVGSIKNSHHSVQLDQPGKDSFRHKESGSSQVILLAGEHMALFRDRPQSMSLSAICNQWFSDFDLVISEGFKNEDGLKIEVIRETNNRPPLYLDASYNIQAIVADFPVQTHLPFFDLNDPLTLANWLCKALSLPA